LSSPASFRVLCSLSVLLLISVTSFAQIGPDQVGRILRGRPGTSDFDYLSPIANAQGPIANPRRIVLLIDSEGLNAVAGLDGYTALKEIGYPDADIAKFLKEGLTFQIVAFPAQGGITAATWDNLIAVLHDQYPEVDDIVRARLPELKANASPQGYNKIMASAPAGAASTPMTAERLSSSLYGRWLHLQMRRWNRAPRKGGARVFCRQQADTIFRLSTIHAAFGHGASFRFGLRRQAACAELRLRRPLSGPDPVPMPGGRRSPWPKAPVSSARSQGRG
jgi:hypothetical protein